MKSTLDHELYEKARKRSQQKKRLYFHAVLFLIGAVFMVILNKFMNFYPEIDWYSWGILAWLFLLCIHAIRVFIMHRFFGKDWEREHTAKLIEKHQKKLTKLEAKLEKEGAFEVEKPTE